MGAALIPSFTHGPFALRYSDHEGKINIFSAQLFVPCVAQSIASPATRSQLARCCRTLDAPRTSRGRLQCHRRMHRRRHRSPSPLLSIAQRRSQHLPPALAFACSLLGGSQAHLRRRRLRQQPSPNHPALLTARSVVGDACRQPRRLRAVRAADPSLLSLLPCCCYMWPI